MGQGPRERKKKVKIVKSLLKSTLPDQWQTHWPHQMRQFVYSTNYTETLCILCFIALNNSLFISVIMFNIKASSFIREPNHTKPEVSGATSSISIQLNSLMSRIGQMIESRLTGDSHMQTVISFVSLT